VIKAQQRARIEVVAASAALVLAVAACGGSSKSPSSSSESRSSPSPSQPASVAKPKFRATLVGQDHAPVATERWHYTVRALSASGQPLAGTVETEFAFGGQVVGRESPPTHALKNGVLKDVVEWPKQAIGQPIALQVVVHTSAGSQTLDWPVMVKP
jgi:hypothetical protein